MKILVDFDGTILECRRRLYRLFSDLVAEQEIGEARYWQLKRAPTSHDIILEQEFGWSPGNILKFKEEWIEQIETDKYLALDFPHPFAAVALQRLASRAQLILLTSRQFEEPVREQVRKAGLTALFTDLIVTGRGRSKVEAVRDRNLTLGPGDILVGDTGEDVLAARELSVDAVCVANGFRDAVYLASYEPDCIYPDLLAFAEAHFPES